MTAHAEVTTLCTHLRKLHVCAVVFVRLKVNVCFQVKSIRMIIITPLLMEEKEANKK